MSGRLAELRPSFRHGLPVCLVNWPGLVVIPSASECGPIHTSTTDPNWGEISMKGLSSANLLEEIAWCPNIPRSRRDADLPCHRIVCSQDRLSEPIQLPEPWSGFLETAPILFVSSNPSISYTEDYPLDTSDWTVEKAAHFFTHRFHDGWVRDGRYSRLRQPGYSAMPTRYWSSVRKRAMELLERDVIPGEDYCLTEVVHCKSKQEIGVNEAAAECTKLYLRRILEASGARVVVVMGAFAANAVRSNIRLLGTTPIAGAEPGEPTQALFAFVPHPASFGPKEFRRLLGEDGLKTLQQKLRG